MMDHKDLIIRLDQQTGHLDMFVGMMDPVTGRPTILSVHEAHTIRERAAADAAQREIELTQILAPCLKTGKSRRDCHWELLLCQEREKKG
jgi:hypothetical protein